MNRTEWAALAGAVLGQRDDVDLRAAPPGRPTLVNGWATRCPPCVEEVPDPVAFADRAQGRPGLVGVLTLSLDAQGRIVHRRSGRFADLAELTALVEQHLGVRV